MKTEKNKTTDPSILRKDQLQSSWIPKHGHSSSWSNALQRLQNFAHEAHRGKSNSQSKVTSKKTTQKSNSKFDYSSVVDEPSQLQHSAGKHQLKQQQCSDQSQKTCFEAQCQNEPFQFVNQQSKSYPEQTQKYTIPHQLNNQTSNPSNMAVHNNNNNTNNENNASAMTVCNVQPRRVRTNRRQIKHLRPPQCIKGNSDELLYIGKHVGSGGYSRCYLAHTGGGKVYALKTISKTTDLSSSSIKQIEKEIRIHEKLVHPSILRFNQYIETEHHIFMVLDYCCNSTLHDMILQRGRLREHDACILLYQLALGVQYLHNDLVHHGDIKMSNILLDKNMRPKIADFGFAIQFKTPDDFRTSLCGTPAYMAPEILAKPCKFGLLSDIWSLGVVGYAMLYGVTAFDATTVNEVYFRIANFDLVFPEVHPSITQDAIYTIFSMLSYKPECRPTAKALVKRSWLTQCVEESHLKNSGWHIDKSLLGAGYDRTLGLNHSALNKAKRIRSLFTARPKDRYLPKTTEVNDGGNNNGASDILN